MEHQIGRDQANHGDILLKLDKEHRKTFYEAVLTGMGRRSPFEEKVTLDERMVCRTYEDM